MALSFSWIRRLFASLSADDRKLAEGVASITGRTPNNLDLFKLAVRHSSYNSGANGEHNERLEFLGDAILGAVIAEYLFKKFPKRNEGFMTEIRSRLVNGESLGELASKIGLDKLIQYEGRRKQPHTHRSMNGDAMEALLGAFYLDTDFDTTRTFIIDRLIKPHYDLNEVVESDFNHKSRMIEWAQKNSRKLSFDIPPESGRGNKDFVANVMIDGKLFATGSGFSKKKAEQNAAMAALKKIKDRDDRNANQGYAERPDNRPARPEGRRDGRRPDRDSSDDRPERGERMDRNDRPERGEHRADGEPRGDRQPRADRPQGDRNQRNARPPRETEGASSEGEEQSSAERGPRPERQPRPQGDRNARPGRVNQEEMYNDAAPLDKAEETGITSTEPRPERVQRERPPRRDNRNGPRRDQTRTPGDPGVGSEPIQPQVDPSYQEGTTPHEPVNDPAPAREPDTNPVSDAEFTEIFRRPGRNQPESRPDAKPAAKIGRVRGPREEKPTEQTSALELQESTSHQPASTEPTPEPAPAFVVNPTRIQPKAVEVAAPTTPPTGNAASGKRKWVNVSEKSAASGQTPSSEPMKPVRPKQIGASSSSEGASKSDDMAREAFASIASDAEAFLTTLPAQETRPAAESNSSDKAADADSAAQS